jgi:arsenate reductase (glutaredoxin)
MKRIYHLSTCNTCQKIIKEINTKSDFELIDIKKTSISEEMLDKAAKIMGSYASLFSKKSMKYTAMGLKDKSLSEKDMRKLILEEYTFLKRPVVFIDENVFAGNARSTIDSILQHI